MAQKRKTEAAMSWKISNKTEVIKCKVKSQTIQNSIFLFTIYCKMHSCLALLIQDHSTHNIAELAANCNPLGWIFTPTHRDLLWGCFMVSAGRIYSPSPNTVKTSVPLMHLTFFFRSSFFRWKWVVLAKQYIKTASCYTLFVILTRQHNSPSPPFSFHHIEYFQQNLSTPASPDIDRFPV